MKKRFFEEVKELLEKGEVKSLANPFEPLKPDDRVVCACSNQVKILVSHLVALRQNLGDYIACLEGISRHDWSGKHGEWQGEARILRDKIRSLELLVRIFVNEDTPDILKESHYSIRKGWIVVIPHEPETIFEREEVLDVQVIVVPRVPITIGDPCGND